MRQAVAAVQAVTAAKSVPTTTVYLLFFPSLDGLCGLSYGGRRYPTPRSAILPLWVVRKNSAAKLMRVVRTRE
jgi:hypothetical protein